MYGIIHGMGSLMEIRPLSPAAAATLGVDCRYRFYRIGIR